MSTEKPFLTLERARGKVDVMAHAEDRYTVSSPSGEQTVVGVVAAVELAHRLAVELD